MTDPEVRCPACDEQPVDELGDGYCLICCDDMIADALARRQFDG